MIWREARHHHERIDLILSDVVMPRMTGFQLMDHIHELDPGQRSIFMSGFYDSEQSENAGRKIQLLKPFTLQKLSETVFEAFKA